MTPRVAAVAIVALLHIGCSPAYEFLVYNASGIEVSINLFAGRCTAKTDTSCSVSAGEVPLDTPQGRLTFHPGEAGNLDSFSESRSGEAFLVRLRFDGRNLLIVAPRDTTWRPIEPQPEGFPIRPSVAATLGDR